MDRRSRRGKRDDRLLAFDMERFFKVSLYIPEKAREDLLRLPLGGEIRAMLEDSKQMGKLKFFPLIFDLGSDEPLDAVYSVIEFRKSIKR